MNDVVKKEKIGFNFLALCFGAYYYAGKGNLKKGLLLTLLGFFPATVILTGIYSGLKANRDLSHEGGFDWGAAILMFITHCIVMGFTLKMIKG